MSNDTMPCGCEGHLDNLDLCRYPAEVERLTRERDGWKARCEVADADNAALLESLTAFVACIGKRSTEIGPTEEFEAWLEAKDAVVKTHPGAALLERLRAAEKVVEAARAMAKSYWTKTTSMAEVKATGDALAAYDAAREGK